MESVKSMNHQTTYKPTHLWLRQINIAFVPGQTTPMLESVAEELLEKMVELGHYIQETPDNHSDAILTTAPFGESLGWRKALLFTVRYQYKLEKSPTIFTLIQITKDQFSEILAHFQAAINKDPLDPGDFAFDGMSSQAYKTLSEQGRRGGPLLSLVRLVQSQSKSIRIILVVGDGGGVSFADQGDVL